MVGAGVLVLRREAEGSGLVHPGAEVASVEPDSSLPAPVGGQQDGRAGLFPAARSGRMRGNGQELKQGTFSLGLRNPFLALRSVRW